ncbi:MAG: dephospho-CoA kinase [bacterium]|nr:dephospho-CoA kinase [bacterium]
MKKIGLTGNIASGKTTVENMLIDSGYKVIDADHICHEAICNNAEIIEKIKNIFEGKDITDEAGSLSRKKIGKIVFESDTERKKLESIIHPHVINKIEKFFISNSENDIVFASVPLLFEIKLEKMFDKIIFVSATQAIRLERLMKRNNFTKEEALQRISAQNTEDDKIKKSDFVIFNNGTVDELSKNVNDIIKKL